MSKTKTVIRFDVNGPNGLEEWEQMNYDNLVSGKPVQRGHLYHEIPEQGYMVGVWDCTAFTDQMMPYTVDEYMFLLDGKITMVMPDGTEILIKAGDAFVIPKGFECQWKQTNYVRKIFMIFDGKVADSGNKSLKRITVPNLAQPDNVDLTLSRTDFLNGAGNMSVKVEGYGDVTQMSRISVANELITVLQGSLILNDGHMADVYNSGDTAYLKQGSNVKWTTTIGTRLIVASYTGQN